MLKSQNKPVIPCGIAVIRNGRDFLISQRNQNDTFGSYWEFPGGKKNSNETFEQCVVRETLEELGIQIGVEEKIMEIRKEHNGKVIWLNFFLCSHISGEPKAIDCQKFNWVDVLDLPKFEFPPANEVVIRELIQKYA